MDPKIFRENLVSILAKDRKILGIGQTGDRCNPLIPGKSDIDLFILCETVPSMEERLTLYQSLAGSYEELNMEVSKGGHWGHGDIFLVSGIDIMPMYFPVDEMGGYVEEILSGSHLNREGRFYPVGRLASIETIHILYETNGAWSNIRNRVREYPDEFFRPWYRCQSQHMLDEEDLGRVLLRKEVLFYHQVLEEFLDHSLQSIFALNRSYFPSRKRTEGALKGFRILPQNFYDRLRYILKTSVSEENLIESVSALKSLGEEILQLGSSVWPE